jgi:CHAT domain-containing protein/tetratricopeptide (TPR) repeat protein
LRAGLIPYLERREHGFSFIRNDEQKLSSHFVRSTDDPLARLAESLFSLTQRPYTWVTPVGETSVDLSICVKRASNPQDFLRSTTPAQLVDVFSCIASKLPETLVWVVDQVEEVLTLRPGKIGDAQRSQFFAFLRMFAERAMDTKIILAIRTEYFGRLVAKLGRTAASPRGVTDYLLTDLSEDRLVKAIKRPSSEERVQELGSSPRGRYGFRFADGLAEKIAVDLQEKELAGGVLPVMQLVCSRLYRSLGSIPEKTTVEIKHSAYEQLRGVEGQIQAHLQDTLLQMCERYKLSKQQIPREIGAWRRVLMGLIKTQIDGTVTTELRPAADLEKEAVQAGSRIPFAVAADVLTREEYRILRPVIVFNAGTGEEIPCFVLGHEAIGLALRSWSEDEAAIADFDAATRAAVPVEWVLTQMNRSGAYQKGIRGDDGANLEAAIARLDATLASSDPTPVERGKTHIDRGSAFQDRIRGDRAENLENAIACYNSALEVFSRATDPLEWATAHVKRASAYADRIRGDRAENLETAIAGYDAALEVFTRTAMPIDWARTQMNRASACADRVHGNRAENLETAIAGYDAALEVFTRTALPVEWARTHMNRARAYSLRIRGHRAENLEAAVSGYNAALEVFTRVDMPVEWATTQMNRASTCADRIYGDHADNLETAIAGYDAALEVFTRTAMPIEWARAHMNRASAYVLRIRGERADNLESAISCYSAALEVLTRAAMPVEWAVAQTNRATAFVERILGNRAENLETAIACCNAALEVRTRAAMPVEWAKTQMNRANAFRTRIRGDRADNLEAAIAGYSAALKVFNRTTLSTDWAVAQLNLADAYQGRIRGHRAENLEIAIACYDAALEVITRPTMPLEWAEIQRNRANAYRDRIRGDRAENLEIAIFCYDAALEVITRPTMPVEWAEVQMNRANAYQDHVTANAADNIQTAVTGYTQALAVFRAEIFPNEHLRASRLLGTALLAAGDWTGAVRALHSARLTSELLIEQDLSAAENASFLEEISPIGPLSAFALGKLGDAHGALRELEAGRARQLTFAFRQRAARDALDLADRDRFDKSRAARTAAEPSLEEQVSALTDTGAVLVFPIFTEAGGLLLLVYPDPAGPQIEAVELAEVLGDALNAKLRGKDGWLATFYRSHEMRTTAIERMSNWLWSLFAGPLVSALDARGVAFGARVVILPQGALGLLPVGLACDPQTGERLFERYELSLAPSLAVLNTGCRDSPTPSFAAIVNPTGDLPFTLIEAAFVEGLFPPNMRVTVQGDQATAAAALNALTAKSHWLFSCHSAFNWSDPRQSGLVLADGVKLTLDALLSAHGLGNPRLVVLSAGETGLHDFTIRSPEEFIGLPAAFLQQGAACVLASFWSATDVSTALLISRFFRNHIADGMRPAAALRAAQIWLRNLTVQDLRALIKDAYQSVLPNAVTAQLTSLHREVASFKPAAKPFQHPFHWGGYAIHGG